MNTTAKRFITVFLLAISSNVGAQSPSPIARCDQPQASGAYLNCALWIDHGELKVGASGQGIATVGRFSPLPLSTWVAGDSALHYALRYERDARRGLRLAAIGASLTVSSLIYARIRGCQNVLCADRTGGGGPIAVSLAGIGFTLASASFTVAGERASVRAIWWHNATLGR